MVIAEIPRPYSTAPASSFRFLATLRDSSLLCEDAQGLVIVDPNALHERLRFEALSEEIAGGGIAAQALLVPRVVRFSGAQVSDLEGKRQKLDRLGFDFEVYSDGDVALKSRPAFLDESRAETLFRELAQTSNQKEALILLAQATDLPRRPEELLDGLGTMEEGWTNPLGRPVLFRLTFREIAKHLDRSDRKDLS